MVHGSPRRAFSAGRPTFHAVALLRAPIIRDPFHSDLLTSLEGEHQEAVPAAAYGIRDGNSGGGGGGIQGQVYKEDAVLEKERIHNRVLN